MRTYGQFCPIARASELLAERWTPIILRNLLLGCTTFTELAAGAPGLSRALLSKRLREFERAGVIDIRPKPDGHGSRYELTAAGRDLWTVLNAMGGWGQKWLDVTPAHADPDSILWSWSTTFLRRDSLPDGRVSVRFEFPGQETWRQRCWLLVEDGELEVCATDPGFDEDLIVVVAEPITFARWHLGLVGWAEALRSGHIKVTGRQDLARALPTWNGGPDMHIHMRREAKRVPNLRRPYVEVDVAAERGRSYSSLAPLRNRSDALIPAYAGTVIMPGDNEYDNARSVWNGAVDRHPQFIARCRDTSDVASVLRFARSRELAIAVKGGGHGVAGMAVCDDGVVIDLTALKSITVDPTSRTARAQAGVLWGELDASTQAFGLATTGGTMSRTGISGLTLGGGIGWLMRRHGLTIDNLESAEVVTAEGKLVTASERELPDLFWALRGGGGNFGVVTAFTYRLHPVGPMLAGPVIWALEDAPEILRRYGEFIAAAPRAVNTVVGLRKAPPAPFLPVELHRRPICMIAMLWAGDPEEGEKALAPMRNAGRPLLDLVAVRPYPDLQKMFDAGVPDGWHYYWKSAVLGTLDNAVIDTIVEHASRVESPLSYAAMFQLGGAVEDVDEDETAYSHRRASHNLTINGVWRPSQPVADRETSWTRDFFEAIEPHQIGAYINFLDRDDQSRVQAAYGDRKYQRLADLKRRYDPDNIFQLNHNIKPSDNRTAEHLPQETIHLV